MKATALDRHYRHEFSEDTPHCSFVIRRDSHHGWCSGQQLEYGPHQGFIVAFLPSRYDRRQERNLLCTGITSNERVDG